jgi:AbrB family looped-hinge helix DNA binding protein
MARHSETTLTQKGQVTIPIEVRKAMGLQPRDKVRFEYDPDGGVAVLRRASAGLADAYGAVSPRKRPENFDDARATFEEAVAQEVIGEV